MAENQKDRVEIELVADDQASESLKRIQEQLEKMNETHEKGPFGKEGHKEGGEKFSWIEAFKIEAVHEGVDKLKEMFGELSKAGAEQDRNARAITGILAMTDKTGQGYDSLLQKGGAFEEELHKTAIEAGVAQEKIVGAFDMIMERSGKSAEASAELTKKMALASSAVPGGLESLSRGFVQMEAGMVRARNPIVQLIASTGELKGGAQAVAKAMEHMTGEQRSKYALEAIEKMADKMAKAKPSFDSLVSSMNTFKEGIIEDVGHPILKSLTPKLAQVVEEMKKYEFQLSYAAGELGDWVSREFTKIWKGGEQAFNKIKDTSTDIWMNFKDVADVLTDAFSQALSWTGDIVSLLSEGFGELTRGLSQTVAQLIDFVKGGNEYTKGTTANILAGYEEAHRMQEVFMFGSQAQQKKAFEGEKKYAPGEVAYQGSTLEGWQKWGRGSQGDKMFSGFSEAAKNMEFSTTQESKEDAAQQFQKAWEKANSEQDVTKAALLKDYGARLVLKDQAFADALINLGDKAGVSWDELFHTMKGLTSIGGASKEEIEDLQKRLRTGPGTAGSGPIFNINHMTINQDFRDMDPERVAIVFQRDLAKAAMNRTQSMMSGAFHP